MTPSELAGRVTLATCAGAAAVALPVGWVAGWSAALGVLAGAAIAVANFRWLVARSGMASPAAGRPGALWYAAAGLRFAAVAAAAAAVIISGWTHPVALVAGFTALPCAVVAQGLRLAREQG